MFFSKHKTTPVVHLTLSWQWPWLLYWGHFTKNSIASSFLRTAVWANGKEMKPFQRKVVLSYGWFLQHRSQATQYGYHPFHKLQTHSTAKLCNVYRKKHTHKTNLKTMILNYAHKIVIMVIHAYILQWKRSQTKCARHVLLVDIS